MENKKVLVIEDFQRIRELLSIFLSKKGFIVFTAADGKEGIDMAMQNKPDLVLLDLNLTDMRGTDVVLKMREFDKNSKIFILSGLCTPELEKEALSVGATGFLNKGAGIDTIIEAVVNALS